MEFGAIQAASGGLLLLLALVVLWLAYRLKRKNQQLRKALAELQRRAKEPAPTVAARQPAPVETRMSPPAPAPPPTPEPILDAFLWQHLTDAFLWTHLTDAQPAPIETPPGDSRSIPSGLCDRAALQSLLEADFRFTGLVVLVGITNSRIPRLEHPAQPFIAELLGPSDFACRHAEDEFLIVCPGLCGAEAQRRLNEISERLWNFQLRGQGSFSVLFSWGGIGVENAPLSDAIASATGRMRQTRKSRVLLFRRKAG